MKYMYIGPTRPFGLPLKHNQIIDGEPAEINPQVAAALEEHPEIAKLVVPVGAKLALARAGLLKSGSVYGKANASLKAKIRAAKKAGTA